MFDLLEDGQCLFSVLDCLGTLAELFPDRQVIGIHAVDLVWGLGTLHCLTQQQPAGQD